MIDLTEKRPLLVTCPKGLASILRKEIEELGHAVRAELVFGVELDGTLTDAMRLNLHLRTAHRVHLLLARFHAAAPDDLYKKAVAMGWEHVLFADGYVAVHAHLQTTAVNDARFASLRLKDAIVDHMRQKTGRRPDSGPDKSKAVVFLHWTGDACQIWLDTSGEPLSRRGYRKMPHKAPMQETLAAGVILAGRFAPGMHFVNPMCGSGTLGIEAALLALRRAPGLLRENFGFMHVKGYDAAEWRKMRTEAENAARSELGGRFILSDSDPAAIHAARQNARMAGLEELLEFERCDFSETTIPGATTERGGVVLLNPEYGKRLGEEKSLEAIYKGVGDFFKQCCQGYTGYIFTGNPALGRCVGLRTSRKIPFFNSKIECRLLEYELYAGSRKPEKKGDLE